MIDPDCECYELGGLPPPCRHCRQNTSIDTLWAREGDAAKRAWSRGKWSQFASDMDADFRSDSRRFEHGFDYRVESENGTKKVVIVEY